MRRITTSAGKHIDYAYNAKGETTSVSDGVSGNTEAYGYDNDYDRLKKYTRNAGKPSEYTETYAYDGYGQVSSVTQSGAAERTYTYAYKETAAHELASITTGMYKFSPQTDKLGRNAGREVWNNNAKLAAEYIYYRKVGDHATNMPSAVYFGKKSGEKFPITENIKYAYDRMGNISRIDENGIPVVWYKYDALNRLIREDNKTFGKTWLYSYDNNGNILCKRETAFTLKENVEESEFESVQYEYEGDKLLAYGTEACEYDAIGNPTTYRGKSVSWSNGRQMVNYNTTAFTYDGLGRRLSKGTINYTYDGNNRIIKQSNGIEFIYDNSGVAGIVYNSATYVYRKDGQGNICALIDSNGNVVVQYKYDAWGNHAALYLNKVNDKEQYSEADEAARFARETGIDALAVAFGTSHGFYKAQPKLDFRVVRDCAAATGLPLVMHGGSGVSDEGFRKAIEAGIRKINYYSYMSKAGYDAAAAAIASQKYKYLNDVEYAAMQAMKEDVKRAISVFSGI